MSTIEYDDNEPDNNDMFSAVFPLLERTYMVQDMFDEHVVDEDLLKKLPKEFLEEAKTISKKLDNFYRMLGMLLIEDDGQAN